jgi:ferritin-like metal-binding protein YciE
MSSEFPAAAVIAEIARLNPVHCSVDFALRRNGMQVAAVVSAHPYPELSAMAKGEPKKLDELFHDTLKDIYYAERKILAALPKMAQAARNDDLRAAFEKHEGQTGQQVARLEQVFELIEKKPQNKRCPAIEGILEAGEKIMKEYKGSPALDAGLLSAAQSVEHYEISRYGTLRTWAEAMSLSRARTLLQQTLDEEIATDGALTELAELVINEEAQATAT